MDSIRTDPRRSRARAAAFALGILLAVTAGVFTSPLGARAEWEENDCKEIQPEQLAADPAPQGRLKFTAKLEVMQIPMLVLRKHDSVHLQLEKKLVQSNVMDIKKISEKDNIRVYGYLAKDAGGPVFIVMNIEKLADDATLYRERIAALDRAGDAAALYKLGDAIQAEGEAARKRDVFGPIAKEAYKAGIALKEKVARPEDAAVWIALCDDYLRLLGDRQTALERLVKAIPSSDQPPSADVRRRLTDLSAYLYGGEYILFEEMKRREGFVLDKSGKWVLKDRAEFEEQVNLRLQGRANMRRYLPDFYAQAAAAGNAQTGMTKEEVSRAIGFPEDVDRIRIGSDVFDAWLYEGRGWFFFDNNVLYRLPDAPRN